MTRRLARFRLTRMPEPHYYLVQDHGHTVAFTAALPETYRDQRLPAVMVCGEEDVWDSPNESGLVNVARGIATVLAATWAEKKLPVPYQGGIELKDKTGRIISMEYRRADIEEYEGLLHIVDKAPAWWLLAHLP